MLCWWQRHMSESKQDATRGDASDPDQRAAQAAASGVIAGAAAVLFSILGGAPVGVLVGTVAGIASAFFGARMTRAPRSERASGAPKTGDNRPQQGAPVPYEAAAEAAHRAFLAALAADGVLVLREVGSAQHGDAARRALVTALEASPETTDLVLRHVGSLRDDDPTFRTIIAALENELAADQKRSASLEATIERLKQRRQLWIDDVTGDESRPPTARPDGPEHGQP